MTIPANNWCSTCQEACHDHVTICTICGTSLGAPPATTSRRIASSSSGFRAVPEFLSDEVRQSSQELRDMLSGLRGQVQNLDAITREAIGGNEQQWQNIPAELLNPQTAGSSGRPTSKEVLAKIPRIVLDDKSSLFRQATLEILVDDSTTPVLFQTVPGELGPSHEIKMSQSSIVVASPRTGKGGILSEDSKLKISEGSQTIVCMERGDGVTFVAKAMLAQQAGAAAVVVANNMSSPWPYVMKDSKGEAQKFGLRIPVVMVKQTDGQKIVECCQREHQKMVRGNLKIHNLSRDCVVCCETFGVSQTVIQLPACGHIFHEQCALVWLHKQNTCPYCRRELPTDDPEYERERRRVQRTHAGNPSSNNESEWSGYYA
jgi:hypothetical protein